MAREMPELDVILSDHSNERTARDILERNVVVKSRTTGRSAYKSTVIIIKIWKLVDDEKLLAELDAGAMERNRWSASG